MIANSEPSAYGLWPLVFFNVALFGIFALSFYKPRTSRDWRSFGAFTAFLVALFTEMYGFPLTIYLLSGWLVKRYPGIDIFSHNAGHLWETLFGWSGDPHFNALHLISEGLIVIGFLLIGSAWRILYMAQREHQIAADGPYAHLRHPQYAGFILIMLGFLLEWPTLITLVMFPFLVMMYARLARREERDSLAEFGERYAQYAAETPAFLPRLIPASITGHSSP